MICPVTQDLILAARMLRDGKLVAFPTETVYGLGANARDENAVARVFAAKQRPYFDPLIVHFAELAQLKQAVRTFPSELDRLAQEYWPGPLTLVLPKSDWIPDLVTSGLDTVAVRIPGDDRARELIRSADLPIAAPSANRFGCISPTTAQHVVDQLGDDIELVLDGGPCRIGVESTVLQWTDEGPVLLRFGGLPVEEIEAIIGPVRTHTNHAAASSTSPPAGPGMLSKHYAPRTRLTIVDEIPASPPRRSGLMTWREVDSVTRQGFVIVETLSEQGDLVEATANFYAALRRLDAQALDEIYAARFPDKGLGRALNDRLQRAAVRE
ncbi:MAG: L-threonylcarbamoyladenylate synthase [Planctomycetota bacterium]|nr:L-threonylcarbamoyladenylate synthase [Planctomycetota bacterium]MDA1214810.1 L-threonylcarbamoyladenylate synthase [Planctomycetota bacterium]